MIESGAGHKAEHKVTFCRICEPLCGMIATVEDGRLTALRPDRDHPLSAGFACQKGIAFAEVVNDPDRITTPLRRLVYPKGRVRLEHADIATEITALTRRRNPDGFGLRMIGMREPRSENSWMHNAPLLMRGQRIQRAFLHADDATARGVRDGDVVRVRSPFGQIDIAVSLTTDLVRGTVAIPHGWGHNGSGGWRIANRAGGANVNELMSSDPRDVEALAGMSWLTGVPVEVETCHLHCESVGVAAGGSSG
ncbi:molybdopterin dinucleotide binding domain-containing protein [Mycolicibacterium smegmatis]|uniref:Anaerobic dehydrogenase, typically n=1 Tax=Mycolicibacterium smegmatis (strain MKD8) TaxID=1214915 RepID=A0A2U9PN55_MYCSE|nr:anaerobic dehydrogenase, typically [Mycolicibacterium smegmatis MKD8]